MANELTVHVRGLVKQFGDRRVLDGLDLAVRKGEFVALLGRSGSGKSTLLRIVAGAAFPTEGRVSVRGRIAPLLSLGAGFQPDMTGRECVEINATMLGLQRAEIADRLGDIIRFAEIARSLGAPVDEANSELAAAYGRLSEEPSASVQA